MEDKNLHIDPSLNKEYPEPDTPVNQAWQSMQLLLDTPNTPANPAGPAGTSFLWKKFFYALMVLIGIAIVTCYFISTKKEEFISQNKNGKNDTFNIATKNTNRTSIITNTTNGMDGKINSQPINAGNKSGDSIGYVDGKTRLINNKNNLLNVSNKKAGYINNYKTTAAGSKGFDAGKDSLVLNATVKNAGGKSISSKSKEQQAKVLKHHFINANQQEVTVDDTILGRKNTNKASLLLSRKIPANSINSIRIINNKIVKISLKTNTTSSHATTNNIRLNKYKSSGNIGLNQNVSKSTSKVNDGFLSDTINTLENNIPAPSINKNNIVKFSGHKKATPYKDATHSIDPKYKKNAGSTVVNVPNIAIDNLPLNNDQINNSKSKDAISIAGLLHASKHKKQKARLNKIQPNGNFLIADGNVETGKMVSNKEQSNTQVQITKAGVNTIKSFTDLMRILTEPALIEYRNNIGGDNKFAKEIKRQTGIPEITNAPDQDKKKYARNLFTSFNAGFQWNIPIPLQQTTEYFIGGNNKSQPLQLLLPTVWISKKINKNELMVSLNFFQQNFTGNNFVIAATTQASMTDSLTITTTTVKKTFGFSTGLQYNYRLSKHLRLELGVKYNSAGGGALLRNQTTRQANGGILNDSTYTIPKSLLADNNLKTSFINSQIGLVYNINKFDAGFNFLLPCTNLAIAPLSLKPFAAQLFIRWRIKK